jgi:uncharacterized protein
MSQETDSQWMMVEEQYRKLYGLSGGYTLKETRGSEELLRHIQKQVYPTLHGETLSSGMFSGALRGAQPTAEEQDFWLQVHTELILYGATEPDASVEIAGQGIKLNPDGTFSQRYALPDGDYALKVQAKKAGGTLKRSITAVVKRTTK